MTDLVIIEKVKLFWPKFYEGAVYEPTGKKLYGVSILYSDLPEAMHYVEPRDPHESLVRMHPELAGQKFASFTGQLAPAVVTHDNRHGMGELEHLFRFFDAANLKRDWGFEGLRADLAVSPYEAAVYDRGRKTNRTEPKLGLRAVRVAYTDVLAKYDELCARYFADASYPRREK